MDWIIIVHLIEGDHFPRWDKVSAECQLWGKPQSTDALNLKRNAHSPFWNHEFKWKLSRKSLVKLRTDRIPVKVTFTGISETGSKATIGYVVLSLRDGTPDGKQQWYSLLNPRQYPAPVVKIEFRICKFKEREEEKEIEKKRKSTIKSRQPEDIPIEVISQPKESKTKESDSESEEEESEEEESDEFESESESDKENKKDEKSNIQAEKKAEPAKAQQTEAPKQPEKKVEKKPQKEESSSSEEEEEESSSDDGSEEEEDSEEETKPTKQEAPNKKEVTQKSAPRPPEKKIEVPSTPHRLAVTRTVAEPQPTEEQPPPEPERHYKFSVDLTSVREFEFSAGNLYCQYNYPLFGSDTPVYTTPTIEVYSLNDIPEEERHNFGNTLEFALPGSFCMFEFALSRSILQKVFEETPMIVEFMDKARSAYDKRIGVAAVKLEEVLHAPKSPIYSGTLQVHDSWIPVMAIEDATVRVGLLRVKVCLQDLGEMPNNTNTKQNNLNTSQATIKRSDLTKTALDDWNFEEQKKEMITKMKQKLKRKEKTFEKELKDKFEAQEAAIMRKHQECMKLEERLRSLLVTTETREKKVFAAEEELRKRRVALQFEYEAKLTQLDDATKRVRNELEHQDHISKMKVDELERQKKNLEKRIKEGEQRYKELEDELHAQRQRQAQGPDAKLQAECLALTIQKSDLEKALEKEIRKKKEFKTKMKQQQQQNEKMQREYSMEQQERLKKEQQDLEAMRFRYMSKEHDFAQTDRQQLETLKMELQRQKLTQETAAYAQVPKTVFVPVPPSNSDFNPTTSMSNRALPSNLTVDTAKLERLIQEREDLLATGMYKPTDRIIKQLDEEIEITQNPQRPRRKLQ